MPRMALVGFDVLQALGSSVSVGLTVEGRQSEPETTIFYHHTGH